MSKCQVWDTSYLKCEQGVPARYGYTWTLDEYKMLLKLFDAGCSLQDLCSALERPAAGVVAKLVQKKRLEYSPLTNNYLIVPATKRDWSDGLQWSDDELDNIRSALHASTSFDIITPKEPAMALKNIETRTFICGKDAASMSDDEIFAIIGDLKAQIESNNELKIPSKKLQKATEGLQADIDALIAYVDGR